MLLAVSTILAYLIGGINPAYILSRIGGFDIRKMGSGNAGASNAIILFGKATGVFVALFDIFKAFGAVTLAGVIAKEYLWCREFAALAVILGHIFPVYMRFRGGKGLACLGGVILALAPVLFLPLLLVEIAVVLLTKYICFVTISASVLFPAAYSLLLGSAWPGLILLPAAAAIVYKHLVNLRRIRRGEEARISFLWNREKELARLGKGPAKEHDADERPD